MDAGFPGSVVLSIVGHLMLVGVAVAAPFVFPAGPVLKVAEGFVVPLPRGGGGSSAPAAPPAAAPQAKPTEAPPEAPAPPVNKVLKPPTEEPRQGLPELESKRSRRKPEPTNPPRAVEPGTTAAPRSAAGAPNQSVGLDIGGPPGIGVPEGTDSGGDWYIASVIQKIRALWLQQLTAGAMQQPAIVRVTIQADGSVTGVAVVGSSGTFTADQAALRAIHSAAPFRELPKEHGTALTIQLRFLPSGR